MHRLLPALALLAIGSAAQAQGLRSPYRPRPAVNPAPYPQGAFVGRIGGLGFGVSRFGGYAPYYSPYYGVPYLPYYGFDDSAFVPLQPVAPPPLPNIVPVDPAAAAAVADATFAARLTATFPAPAEVTLDGRALAGPAAEIEAASPPLKVGESHTFKLAATWTLDGKRYRAERAVAVKAGDRGRLTVVSGDEVK